MTKPSILMINRVYPEMRGASGRILNDLAKALEKSGWRVTVLTTGDKAGEEVKGNITIKSIKPVANHKSPLGYARLWLKLLSVGKNIPRHDIVLTLTDPPLLILIGRILARSKKMHHVHWCHDLYPDLFKSLGITLPDFIYNKLFSMSRRAMNACDRVVVIGNCMAKNLSQTGVVTNRMAIIPNWADLEIIAPSAAAKIDTSAIKISGKAKKPDEMFRDDSPKFRVLYAGNIGRAHPMRSVIEAATILAKHSEIEFVFVGDQNVHGILARERGKRALENIKFMPYQPIEQLRNVMESGDVHLVTMNREAKGQLVPCKFYAGLTVGRPTIFVGPRECEVSQVITNYNAGKIVPPGDGQALADAILAYRNDGNAWFQAQEGALRAGHAYHPSVSLHKWTELLEQVRISG